MNPPSYSSLCWRIEVVGSDAASAEDRQAWPRLANDLGALDEGGVYYLRRYRAAEMLVFALRARSAEGIHVRLSRRAPENRDPAQGSAT